MHKAQRAAFIVGVPRSGTTWTLALLAEHPMVAAIQQSALFEALEPLRAWWESTEGYGKRLIRGAGAAENSFATTRGWRHVGEVLVPGDFDRLCRPIVDHVFTRLSHARGGAEMVVTQTPENLMLWRLIRRLAPDARFLHVIRDPRAVLASQRAAAKGWARGVFEADAESVARMWRRYVATATELKQSGANYLEVQYEALHAHPAEELARIFAWLELPASTEFLRSAIESCSITKMKQANLGPKDFVRSGLAEGWRQELSKGQMHTVEYLLAPLMRERGYDPVTSNSGRKPVRLAVRHALQHLLGRLVDHSAVARRLVAAMGASAFFLNGD